MKACRLANASPRRGTWGKRYIVDAPIHEALDPEMNISILDIVTDERYDAASLLIALGIDHTWLFPNAC